MVEADFAVNVRAVFYVNDLNTTGYKACVFKNNVTPDPSFDAGSFIEADYTGYAEQALNGKWSSAVQVAPGHYTSTTASLIFPPNTGLAAQTLYGVFVIDHLGNVVMSFRFAAPYILNPGDPSLVVQLNYNFWAASTL